MEMDPRSMVDATGSLSPAVRRWFRVLLVEDDAEMRSLLAALLRAEGYAVEAASDGLKAAHTLFHGDGGLADFDLIITDQRMPGFDGLSLTKAVHGAFGPPVILLSAFANEELVADGAIAGAIAVLAKPFDVDHLLSLVQDVATERP